MSSLTVDSARQALSAVIDPALGKDVIKLRIVSNIEVQGSDALVTVDIPTYVYP
jgi:metal-sulfur cluster biosynthetic enzyme